MLTRDIILHELRDHDATRPYLPSSPYLDEIAHQKGLPSEEHLWGPRDYFKGDYYKNPVCHFASEIGYHGCNAADSLKKFISPDSLLQMGTSAEGCKNGEWLLHATCMETTSSAEGEFEAAENSAVVISELPEKDHAFYYIEWRTKAGNGVNHHACSLGEKWAFEKYLENMKKAGFYQEFFE